MFIHNESYHWLHRSDGQSYFSGKSGILAYRKKKAVRATIHSAQYARYNFLFRRRGARSSMDSTAEPPPNTGRERDCSRATGFAQFIAVCSSSILAETLGYSASFSSPLHENGAFSRGASCSL